MTVDPENIKAMLATQFNDFGKGKEFHKNFDMVQNHEVWKNSLANYSSLAMEFSM